MLSFFKKIAQMFYHYSERNFQNKVLKKDQF